MEPIKFTLPSEISLWPVVQRGLEAIFQVTNFPEKEGSDLLQALQELFSNAVHHAYRGEPGQIEIAVEPFDNAIVIHVHDWGEPFNEGLLRHPNSRGFARILKLVDEFKYFNLGLDGKKFTIAKYTPIQLRLREDVPFYSDIGEDRQDRVDGELTVRLFRPGDEVWIPKLLYRNYGYTYFKDTFYYPQKILELERNGRVISVVAQRGREIVGHFAMVRLPQSNIAEIGIAVVDPQHKGKGIMKQMFHLLLFQARKLGLKALFGEAITFHPYSQRANARFGFFTSALMLGDLHQMIQLKDHKYPMTQKRGAVALEYKILRPSLKSIAIPERYRFWIERTYAVGLLPYKERPSTTPRVSKIATKFDPTFNIAMITIDDVGPDFPRRLQRAMEELIAKHPDMIYADVNLELVSDMEFAIETLHQFDFFYSGIAFLRRFDWDYLRLQFEVSEQIEEQRICCYSHLCKALHHFILEDKLLVHKKA
ncbi:MAG: hypothetical protein C6I00_04350 [Nitratiruptor sp.]|nr:hypothetical protein [Nitratiruptor sp.]NPA84017.1 GNAT family N-acetyltransferase [Campylobacterota bacterium]